ncbi:MAG: cupin domain-containing protein [Bacteroidales bacterium]|nr:cupin domain-containing protein [Bacteroidales bacterium]
MHSILSDEIWYFNAGTALKMHMIDMRGDYTCEILGNNITNNERPQLIIPAGTLFGAEVMDKQSFALCSCMVSPGFDFADFHMPGKKRTS